MHDLNHQPSESIELLEKLEKNPLKVMKNELNFLCQMLYIHREN